ncbi:MAG: phosphatidylglycerophosphatase A [Oceanospirillales bacterium]|uniref:Phosphatidylglycerophosphatase A n=1 Tax=Marinobacterium halophilum TaxID=267374 RepID=A0A2P8EXG2_9GAMM|nr:phosphatidylglycerophosphatase A [Marinobacterium halophilum]MBR9827201.1 phosphatidylglycerophosphatase A [Oceanospirillales bacterium]PSL14156.1 phosphatidylglycerophosphatase [Marinobacterium halophilum]
MNKAPASVWRNPIHFLAFGLGSGAAPKAPGTVGTLAAVPLWYLMAQTTLPVYLCLTLIAFVIGIWLCGRTSRDLGVHDHGGIVWDEFVGYWITMIAVPVDWVWALLGFALFRLFDIWKPWPIGPVDRRVHGGLGIMLDDVLAGAFAALVLQGLLWWWG